jgi:CRP-like cAMP-binding protein
MVEKAHLARNFLLSRLSPEDLDLLQPLLTTVELSFRQPLEERNRLIEHVYFPAAGIVSIVADAGHDAQIEVGIIGYEGVSGHPVIIGDGRASNSAFAQVPGTAFRIKSADLRSAVESSASLRQLLLRFIQVFAVQAAQTALANGQSKLDERLTRWLLMAHDRLGKTELPLTHELLSIMLGVRRAGVTQALHKLEGEGLIHARRGIITILDRRGLEKIAGAIYGAPEAEYKRLIGQPR